MSNLEQLQAQAKKNQSTIEKLQAQFEAAENAVMRDPENGKAALEAAAYSMQITGAKRALEATQAQIEDEKRRMYEQEVKAARAELATIEKQVDKIREAEIAKMQSFFAAYEKWQGLVSEHEEIVNKYRITDVKNVRSLDESGGGMWLIRTFLERWRGSLPRETRERLEELR